MNQGNYGYKNQVVLIVLRVQHITSITVTHTDIHTAACVSSCVGLRVYVCVCDRLKQTKISGFLQQHAIPYHYYYYYYYFYVQPSSFDHFNAYEYEPVHTYTDAGERNTYTHKSSPLMTIRLEYEYGPYACECAMTMLAFRHCTKHAVVYSNIDVGAVVAACMCMCVITRVYAFNTSRLFRIDIYTLHIHYYFFGF